MRPSILLQSGEVSIGDYFDGDLLRAALDDLVWAAGGEATFGVIIGAVVILSFWLAGDGDLTTPAVLTVLLGVIMFPLLPATYLDIARVVAFLGLVAGILAGLEKYYAEGAQ